MTPSARSRPRPASPRPPCTAARLLLSTGPGTGRPRRAPPPAGRAAARRLFQVLTEREEKNSLAIASNESFSGWAKTFTDPRLCAAIVDRLTFGGTIIETGTDSYRLAQTRARNHVAS